ncbi:MAG: hypothetical protein JAY84_09665 [Candidatus Thiodiazotropha taylori]|nr:hypothetical protein [Candidatus Thiodiazotropha taylori]
MSWKFSPLPVDQVEMEVTQRDQFRNDDVDISDTIVRESVQNSSDASSSGKVRVRFSIIDGESGYIDKAFMKGLFTGQLPHARSAGLDVDGINFSKGTALVIEDFGTKGLTGATDKKDEDNFSDFWRRHGKSHKSGKHGGRHGLGKIVYSLSSRLGTFFGITRRENGTEDFLMGQTVLNIHSDGGTDYPAHSFYSDTLEKGKLKGLPIPITDKKLIGEFKKHFQIERTTEAGLSLIIPFPESSLNLQSMIKVAIENYFIPVLRDHLVIEFNGQRLDSTTLREMAKTHATGKIQDADQLFTFIEDANQLEEADLICAKPDWNRKHRLTEEGIDSDIIEELRNSFLDGELIGLKLPIQITRKNGNKERTYFKLYIQRNEQIYKGRDFYVRAGITVPGESKFKERKAFGMLVAEDDAIAEFLGDAENAAHTMWNSRAEKLRPKYKNADITLRAIRNSLIQLHDLLTQTVDMEDKEAFIDFLWTKSEKTGRKKSKSSRQVKPNIDKPNPTPYWIESINGGFILKPSSKADTFDYPIEGSIRIAYDVLRGNPIAKHTKDDFDLTKPGDAEIATEEADVHASSPNELSFTLKSHEFSITVCGLDSHRDLIVDARR